MAYIDEKPQDQAQNQDQQQDIQVTSGQTATVGGAAPQPNQQGQQSADQKRSGMGNRLFNLRSFLNQNQNVNLTKPLEGNLQKQAGRIQSGLQQTQQQFGQQSAAEKARLAQGEQTFGKPDDFVKQANQYVQGQGQFANSTLGQTEAERIKNFQQYYQGQQNLFDFQKEQQIKKDVSGLEKDIQNLGTETGRFDLLRKTFDRPNYNVGQQRLDQLFIQADPTQANRLRSFQKQNQGVNQQKLEETQNQIKSFNTEAQQRAQALRDQLQAALPKEIGTIEEQTMNTFQQKQAEQDQFYKDLEAGLASGELTKEQFDALGLKAEEQRTYAANLMQGLNRGEQATLENVINADEAARYFALSKLTPEEEMLILNQEAQQFGTFDPRKVQSTIGELIQKQKTEQYDPAYNRAQAERDRVKAINDATRQLRENMLKAYGGEGGGIESSGAFRAGNLAVTPEDLARIGEGQQAVSTQAGLQANPNLQRSYNDATSNLARLEAMATQGSYVNPDEIAAYENQKQQALTQGFQIGQQMEAKNKELLAILNKTDWGNPDVKGNWGEFADGGSSTAFHGLAHGMWNTNKILPSLEEQLKTIDETYFGGKLKLKQT